MEVASWAGIVADLKTEVANSREQIRLGVDIGGVIVAKYGLEWQCACHARGVSPCGTCVLGYCRGDGSQDTSFFSDNYLRTPAVVGVVEGLAACVRRGLVGFFVVRRVYADGNMWGAQVEMLGAENVVIVSKAGRKIAAKSLEWMAHNEVLSRTGVLESNIHFCRTREEKGPLFERYMSLAWSQVVCLFLTSCVLLACWWRRFGLTHFVDDTRQVRG